MSQSPEVGDIIRATDEDALYKVNAIWGRAVSKVIDFTGRSVERIGFDQHGNEVMMGRGFSLHGGNWEIVKKAGSEE